MKTIIVLSCFFISNLPSFTQTGWKVCNAPVFNTRVDDIFMVNAVVGYAVSGDGKIVKTTDGGENWHLILQTSGVYCRSVEFVDASKGFVGGFSNSGTNILRRTTDGGATWTDLTSLIHPKARKGICGLAVADGNTIYGGGNWFQDSAYLIKSTDGGNTWNFIDMHGYASSIIDMHFLNKDTGFVTGRGLKPLQTAIILYTTDGGASWSYKFRNNTPSEYCWKIQRLTNRIYFASIEDMTDVPPKIVRSVDGGMTWSILEVARFRYNIEGVGFINPLHGWAGGDQRVSFETKDGGKTWDAITVCPFMNRVFKVNDTTIFATGDLIWKYNGTEIYPPIPAKNFAWMRCYPNPVKDMLSIEISLSVSTHVMVTLFDASGRRVKVIDNAEKLKGSYQYHLNTSSLAPGSYFVVLKTHEDKQLLKIIVSR